MANDARRVDAEVHVGAKQDLSKKRTLLVHFHDFESLEHDKGQFIESAPMHCHGCAWSIRLYPQGDEQSKEDRVSLHLKLKSCQKELIPLSVKFSLTVGSRCFFEPRVKFLQPGYTWGWTEQLLYRSEVLDSSMDYLVDGTFSVNAEIQIYIERPALWEPPSTSFIIDNIVTELNRKETCDVIFRVEGKAFYAHKFLLRCQAPALALLCENAEKDEAVELKVDPDRFYSFLCFVYSGKLPREENLKTNAVELLDVADRFGCLGLKMMAEAELVRSGIDVESVSDLILVADSKNCAMLKEATFHFFKLHSDSVMKTKGYDRLQESRSLLAELLKSLCSSGEASESSTSVSELRKRLYQAGEDIDGTKEALVKRVRAMGSDA